MEDWMHLRPLKIRILIVELSTSASINLFRENCHLSLHLQRFRTTDRALLPLFSGDTKTLTLACKRGIEQDDKKPLELIHNPQLNVLKVNVTNS